eukprot:Blabericola_migrator_1__5962@NODE_3003_length_2122_cov_15_307543_g1878_i0_p1_GENE_NODE_3003_length_2122_cov_15_307543_g1878_i0NODE_3003_length_2122_cov_15_307543_g1878_i0_p1_ORF_typecomplete_len403_score62_77_NODE_3003_length_2122_cov_15_307543_g1878_i02101418
MWPPPACCPSKQPFVPCGHVATEAATLTGHLEPDHVDFTISPCRCSEQASSLTCSDELIDWTISHAAATMTLSPSEECALKVLLYRNYIRTYEALQLALESERLSQVLHPIVVDHLSRAIFETESLVSLQSCRDAPVQVPNPTRFLHGTIFVHRLLPISRRRARMIATYALDLSVGVPLLFLYNQVGAIMNVTPSRLRFFTSDNKVLPNDGILLPPQDNTAPRPSATLPCVLPLANHGIAPGSSIYVVPLVWKDQEGLRLYRHFTHAHNASATMSKSAIVEMPFQVQTELESIIDSTLKSGDAPPHGFDCGTSRVPSMAKMQQFAAAAEPVGRVGESFGRDTVKLRVDGRMAKEVKNPYHIRLRKRSHGSSASVLTDTYSQTSSSFDSSVTSTSDSSDTTSN